MARAGRDECFVAWLAGDVQFLAVAARAVDSLRFVNCVLPICGNVFYLCGPHDWGQRYCSAACSTEARRCSRREAGRRYQRTRAGKFAHAAREQDRRDRQRERDYVTHQGRKELALTGMVRLDDGSDRDERDERVAEEDRDGIALGVHRSEPEGDAGAGAGRPGRDAAEGAVATGAATPARASVAAGGAGAWDSFGLEAGGPPLYTRAAVHRGAYRRRDGLGGLGDFADLGQLLLFEVAR